MSKPKHDEAADALRYGPKSDRAPVHDAMDDDDPDPNGDWDEDDWDAYDQRN